MFAGKFQKQVGPLMVCGDIRVFSLVTNLATVANLRNLDLRLIINLIVDKRHSTLIASQILAYL